MPDVEHAVATVARSARTAGMAQPGVPLPETLTLAEARQTAAALETAIGDAASVSAAMSKFITSPVKLP